MPNIEIHGHTEGEIEERYKILQTCFATAAYENDIIVTGVRSGAYHIKNGNKREPFLRVWITPAFAKKWLNDLKMRLSPLEIDLEIAYLKEFVPKT